MRAFLGVLAGIVVAILVESGVEIIANQFYPTPSINAWDAQQVGAALAARPTGALLIVVLGYLIGAFAGGAAGKSISGGRWGAWTPGLVLAAMVAILAFSFPLPGWSVVAMLAAPLIGAVMANHLIGTRASTEVAEI